MKIRINDIDSLTLTAENDAEQALIDHWQDKITYSYTHEDDLGSGIGVVFCDDDAFKEFVREEEEPPLATAEPDFAEMLKAKMAEYGKWTGQAVTMFNNATVTSAPSAPTPKLSLWGNKVMIEEEEPTPLVIQVDDEMAAKIKAAWENCMGGVVASSATFPTDEEELAKEIAELEELKVFFEDCLAEQELLGRATTAEGSDRHTTRMFKAALNVVRDLLGEEYDKQA